MPVHALRRRPTLAAPAPAAGAPAAAEVAAAEPGAPITGLHYQRSPIQRQEQEVDRMDALVNLPTPIRGPAPSGPGVIQASRSPTSSRHRKGKRPGASRLRHAPKAWQTLTLPSESGSKIHRTRLRQRTEKRAQTLDAWRDILAQIHAELQYSPEQLQMLGDDAVIDLLEQGGATALGEWGEVLPHLTGDTRKAIAANVFRYWLANAGDTVAEELVRRKLAALQSLFKLRYARLSPGGIEGEGNASAAFAASPAVYVPLIATATRSPYLSSYTPSSDTLKPVKFDPDQPTPAGQLVEQFNSHFAGKAYDPTDLTKTIDKLKDTQNNETLLSAAPKKRYDRPGSVEATITTPKPTAGRTGSGETEIGWFGGDEEQLIEGTRTIPYEGGHLIGDQLMDGDNTFDMYKSWNLAPQAKSFNNPLYITSMENAAVKALKAGAVLDYKVDVAYPASDYKLKSGDAVKNAVDPTKTMSSGDSFVAAVAAYLTLHPTANTDFRFLARVPNYWKAEMSDTASKGVISGSGRNDPRGPYSATAIGPTTSYKPSGVEQFTFSLAADASQLALPTKGPKKKLNLASYSAANAVTLSARQKSFVDAPPPPPLAPVVAPVSVAPKIGAMSAADLNKIIKHQKRALSIHAFLQSNVITALTDLTQISGVSHATVNLLTMAGVTI